MKTVVALLLCLAYALSHTTTNGPQVGARCNKDSDCPTQECCVHSPLQPHQKKRFVLDFLMHDHGFCRLQRKENQTCFPLGHDLFNPSLHEFHCPCEAGLECRGMKVHESQHQIMHENPICQQPES